MCFVVEAINRIRGVHNMVYRLKCINHAVKRAKYTTTDCMIYIHNTEHREKKNTEGVTEGQGGNIRTKNGTHVTYPLVATLDV